MARDTGNGREVKTEILRGARSPRSNGFTLMELVIVMTVMAILLAVAIPIYITHIKRAKEVVLKQNLDEMRRAIDKFTVDKEHGPASLDELVSAGYLRSIPIDPIANSSDAWRTEMETETTSADVPPGIKDVKSSAEGVDSVGKAYTEY